MSVRTISPKELDALRQRGEPIDLIDVRTPAEFREIHATIARNVPLDRLDPQAIAASLHGSADKPLYVICRSGKRADQACQQLEKAGLNVVNVEGGTLAWEQAGLPVVRGKTTISLERQVRIAAGSLVLVGVALGWLIHPAFYLLAAFIGAGLVFAGITDTCGMGMLLARMPWNQVKEATSQQAERPTAPPSGGACCGG
jgi:rhodanese-related sulfurtransferase